MIRWDPAGEHIIVERPEQLALHVLPSVYRQSRFASFSRQLNVSRNFLDIAPTLFPATLTRAPCLRSMVSCARSICATWTRQSMTPTRAPGVRGVLHNLARSNAHTTWFVAHPTLNRHSPPEVVANFKRRVPPRLPKPRKRDNEVPQIPPPRSAIGTGPLPLSIPVGDLSPYKGRARGFSAPGSYTPLNQPGAAGWGTSYPRSTLPPLNVPSDPPSLSTHGGMYSHSSHTLHPVTPSEDTQSTSAFGSMSYSSSGREMMLPSPSSQYQYADQSSTWSFTPGSASTAHSSGSLSSLLNPSSNITSGYSSSTRPQPAAINTYTSSYPQISRSHHSAGPVSPDSRPTSGYSASSMSSLPTPYEDSNAHHFAHDYSRPGSGHHRPMSPSGSRPPSSKSYPNGGSLSIRRERRHSQAVSPYPSPYSEHPSQRPSTSPHPAEDHTGSGGIPRVRSMIQLPSVDTYNSFNPAQADFAYAAVDESNGHANGMYGSVAGARSVRPSTSASSLSTTSSAANTPGADGYGNGAGDADITRCE